MADRMAHSRELRDLDIDIAAAAQDIDNLRGQLQHELGVLQEKKTHANNNLAGATWLESISQEMAAVTHRYDIEIKAAQGRLDTLRAQRKAMTAK
jgi:predicted  nucleic acid-binding Zn-ribbon protein